MCAACPVLSSLSNLTIGSSSSTVDDLLLDSLRPFNQSLGLIDQTLHSSTGQHHSVNRDWVDRQILAANRLISCFDNPSDQANQLSFNDLLRPSLTPPDQSVTAGQRLGSQNNHRHPRGLAQAHLASLGALPPDRFITNRHPQHSAPSQPGLGSDDDDGSIRSFYDSFVHSTLRNQRSYLIPTSPDIHPKPRPSPGSVPSSSASSSSPSPIPQSPSTAPLPSSSSLGRQPVHSERVQQPVTRDQAQPIPIGPRRDSSSPDPLEMNLRVRSHSKNARLHPRASLGQVNYQTPPLKKTRVNPKTDSPIKLTRPHSLGNRPTIAPILLPASFPQNCSAPDHAQEINTPSGAKFSEKSNSSRAPGIKKGQSQWSSLVVCI
ncbi:hypothetical protein BY996DRAFT_465750 [Phakopsora pachyrhizi]|nr:hypothetical protein BY996DRAFT_465750 [Phakopsora pachyrhizi]